MVILQGATQGVAALKAEALAIHHAKTKKYHLRAGDMYLHQGGEFLQEGRKWAWKGTVDQARALRRKSEAAVGCKLRSIPHSVESGE